MSKIILVQYCPDVVRMEFANIGVIDGCCKAVFVMACCRLFQSEISFRAALWRIQPIRGNKTGNVKRQNNSSDRLNASHADSMNCWQMSPRDSQRSMHCSTVFCQTVASARSSTLSKRSIDDHLSSIPLSGT